MCTENTEVKVKVEREREREGEIEKKKKKKIIREIYLKKCKNNLGIFSSYTYFFILLEN